MHQGEGHDTEKMKFKISDIPTKDVNDNKTTTNPEVTSLNWDESMSNKFFRKSTITINTKDSDIIQTQEPAKDTDHKKKENPCSLFPAINKSQFIPGNDQFIPLMHDNIR